MTEMNGLQRCSIRSKSESHTDITNIFATIGASFEQHSDLLCVAYLDHEVLIDRYRDDLFDPKYLKRCRVFNSDAEWLIWRSHGVLNGRFRRDYGQESPEGMPVDVVDAKQVIFGKDSEPVAGKDATVIFEALRGIHLELPFSGIELKEKRPQHRIRLKTRNYIGTLKDYDEEGQEIDTGQAGYVDCRFLGFCDEQQDLPYKEDA